MDPVIVLFVTPSVPTAPLANFSDMAPIHTNRRGTPSPAISQLETKFPFSPLSLAPSDCGTSQDDQDESRLQECWDENIAKNLNLPEGYRDVQVLMIKWADDIDELKTREEVRFVIHYKI